MNNAKNLSAETFKDPITRLQNGGMSYLLASVEIGGREFAIRIEPQAFRILTLEQGALRCPKGTAHDRGTLIGHAEALGLLSVRELELLVRTVSASAASAYSTVQRIASGEALTAEPPVWVHPAIVEARRAADSQSSNASAHPAQAPLSLDGMASIEGQVSEDATKPIGRDGGGHPSIFIAKLSPDVVLRIERGGYAVWLKSRNGDHWFSSDGYGVQMSGHQVPVQALAALREALNELKRDLRASEWKAAEALASKLPNESTIAFKTLSELLTSPARPAHVPDWVPVSIINRANR
ncbi:hypothetical protein DDZ18_08850 [Marinicauda salina]|uniref:Uncharacterized protein n=1 Tax=Marinicauda salina TaxID=2135793 RepID=A0A2U2BUS1_9PROT|nr:hypothetical protein [Marinicauda salina]PWE17752.1 hypothetical protein DDZ18_08850 [Marinicauda salina]